jgi:glyoxylase-like metal-dependent hydrolase (beta-lactamase superfamily II)
MILETVNVGALQVNCYIVSMGQERKAVIIDPGDSEEKIRRVLDRHRLTPACIINTHGHIDHIGCDDVFGVPVYAHRDEISLLKDSSLNFSSLFALSFSVKSTIKALHDKEHIVVDGVELEVIHTPGHSPGGLCLLMKKPVTTVLFSGDTLFYESVGRTDFPGADSATLLESIREKLLVLSDDTVVYPGHGASSTIGHEKKHNPFLNGSVRLV